MTLDELVNSEIRFNGLKANGLKANGLEVNGPAAGSTADCEKSVCGTDKAHMVKLIRELLDVYGGIDEEDRSKFKHHITELLDLAK